MIRQVTLFRAIGGMIVAAAAVSGGAWASTGPAGSAQSLTLTLQNHRFSPSILTIPAGARVRVTLINRDAATEEFDSHDLRVEQVVTPMGKVSFNVGPLRPGQYSFIGEFHAGTAQGKVIASTPAR